MTIYQVPSLIQTHFLLQAGKCIVQGLHPISPMLVNSHLAHALLQQFPLSPSGGAS